jgi:hypothetical protein
MVEGLAMPLEPTNNEVIREADGFVFFMRIHETIQTVRVFVADDVLDGDGVGADQLRSQFDADRTALEAVACEKYDHGRITANGLVVIGLADIVGFFG